VKFGHLIRLPYFFSLRSQAGSDIMATDWDGVRATALDCLNATWGMVCWAARSQEDDYDTEMAALHLAAMDTALNTFRRAREILQPGLKCTTSDVRHSPVFDALALASVGEGPRPDFKLCATAHEKAFQLLRMAILGVENGLNDELDRRGTPVDINSGTVPEFMSTITLGRIHGHGIYAAHAPQNARALFDNHLVALAAETQRLARIYEQKLAALAALKKSLLHQAFSEQL
jgi:hypothetical protein